MENKKTQKTPSNQKNQKKEQKPAAKKTAAKPLQQQIAKRKNGGSALVQGSKSVPMAISEHYSSYFEVGRSNRVGAVRIKGQDYLGSVFFDGASNKVQKNLLVSPCAEAFQNTRLEKYGQLYEKFLFRNLKFHYQSAMPSTTAGNVLLAFDRDMADPTPSADEDGTRQLLSFEGSKMRNCWESFTIDCSLADMQDFYYTNYTEYEGRLVYQGQLYLASVQGVEAGQSASLWVEYDIELFDPQLHRQTIEVVANKPSGGPEVVIPSGNAWEGMFNSAVVKVLGTSLANVNLDGGDTSKGKVHLPGGTYLITQNAYSSWNGGIGGKGFAVPYLIDVLTGNTIPTSQYVIDDWGYAFTAPPAIGNPSNTIRETIISYAKPFVLGGLTLGTGTFNALYYRLRLLGLPNKTYL